LYISRDLKLVFLASPRTGSRSVSHYLETVHGADPWGKRTRRQGHHSTDEKMLAALRAKGYTVAATVRNHWDHLVSWFTHTDKGFGKECVGRFDLWVFRFATQGNAYHKGHDRFGRFTEHADVILRYENLESDLAELVGTKAKLTRIGYTPREPYQSYFTPEVAEFVGMWWRDEIERYGYTFEDQG
jgi:hypothetical protein